MSPSPLPKKNSPLVSRTAIALLLLFIGLTRAHAQDVTINEFMASNTSTSVPGQAAGEFDDWIEIRNNGASTINLFNWHLTDDEGLPFKWTFPNFSIPAGGYRIVFASGDDTPGHTNFGLASRGGYLALVRPDLSIASNYDYPKQFSDVPFGIPGNGSTAIHLTQPTPGAANGNTEYLFVQDTGFSQKRGHYSSPISVAISTETPSSVIRYTTDGSEPQLAGSGTTYTSPITITTTTVLRARAFRSGYAPTNIDTQTYIYPEDVAAQSRPSGYPTSWGTESNADYNMDPDIAQSPTYSAQMLEGLSDIPTVSVATQRDQIFGSSGIYSRPQDDTLEVAVSAEYFHPSSAMDGTNIESGFQLDCGFKIQGGASRNPSSSIKHSFSLRFRSEYGAGKLDYELFPDSEVDEFDSIHLRAMYNNSWIHSASDQRERATMIRDQWIRDSLIAMGQADGGHGDFVHLYINGLYWGVYNLHERLENDHYAAYNDGNSDTIDSKNPAENVSSFNNMRSTVSNGDWPDIVEVIDVDSYIDYYLIQHFGHNDDLKGDGNWRAAGGGSSDAPWRFYAWDSERTLENVSDTGALAQTQDGAGLINSLDNHEEFRFRFADRAQMHLTNGGALTPARNLARWSKYSDLLDRAIIAESARWGDDRRSPPYSRNNEWIPEVNNIKNNFFRTATPNRTSFMIDKFESETWPSGDTKLLNTPAPQFQVSGSPQHGGQIAPADPVGFASGPGTVYYTTDGSDPRVPANGSAPVIALDDGAPCSVLIPSDNSLGQSWVTRTFNDSAWISGNSGVGFDRPGSLYDGLFNFDVRTAMFGNTASCYVRVPFNIPNQATLDSIGTLALNMKYDDGFVAWINGTMVASDNAPGSLAWDSNAGGDRSPESENIIFTPFDASSARNSLVVGTNVLAIQALNSRVRGSDFLCIPQLTYSTTSATGISLSATAFSSPFTLPATTTIRARSLSGSGWSPLVETSFIVEPPAQPGDVIISEISYHPADPTQAELAAGQSLTPPQLFDDKSFEFIELFNLAPNAVSLDGVAFSDGISFTFGPTVMASGERIVLVSDLAGFAARHGSPSGIQVVGPYTGSLKNSGEDLAFTTPAGTDFQSFAYDDKGAWPGRADGAASSLELEDPSNDPAQAGSWRPSSEFNGSPGTAGSGPDNRITINEVLTNSDLPALDTIELYNRTGATIDISGWYISDSRDDYTRFQIPTGTTIPAGGFLTFDEGDFNSSGTPSDFALSGSGGDDVYLLEANAAGAPTRFVDHAEFGASFSGVTLGSWPDGSGQFVPLTTSTLGSSNSRPRIGDVIITEIMYHPTGPQPGSEFIEITNTSASSVNLANWTLRGGSDFDFTASHQISPGASLVLVNFDPSDTISANAFRTAYGIGSSVNLAGPTEGALSNGGDTVRLQRADTPPADDPTFFPQVIEDISNFDDATPWPIAADGGGSTLHRILPADFGNLPGSWSARAPDPGSAPLSDDPDDDGIPALIEYALNLDPNVPDNHLLPQAVVEGSNLTFSYPLDTNKTDITYELQVSDDLQSWAPLTDTLTTTSGNIQIRKAVVTLGGVRKFIRLKVTRIQ